MCGNSIAPTPQSKCDFDQANAPNKAEQNRSAITLTPPVETFTALTAAPCELVLDALDPVAVPVPVELAVLDALLTAAVAVAFSPLLQNTSPPLPFKHVSSTDTFCPCARQ